MGDGLALLPCIPEMMRAMSDIPTNLPEPTPSTQRCAVYTRVSMDNSEDDKHWVTTDRIYENRG